MIDDFRITRYGSGIDAYEVVELHQDGAWVHGNTFYETDDWMSHNMSEYLSKVRSKIKDHRPKYYRCKILPTAFVRDKSASIDFAHREDFARSFCARNTDFFIETYYKDGE
jgi:hypothetical protein